MTSLEKGGTKMKMFKTCGRKIRWLSSVLVSAGIYTFFVWLFFGNLGVHVALALALTLPIMLMPAALIWYINIGGICSAIRHRS